MKNIPLKQLKEEIPKGYYCYTYVDEQGTQKFKKCKYWSKHPEHGSQNDGYCSYLELGDWMENDANAWENKDGDITYMGLLWDQVKACDINHWTDEEIKDKIEKHEIKVHRFDKKKEKLDD